jgi:hypothetical protein
MESFQQPKAQELEHELANIVFGNEPLKALENTQSPQFASVDRRQFELFHMRLIILVEERLNAQFGGCLGLFIEILKIEPKTIAIEYLRSPEFRQVREEFTAEDGFSDKRFEIGFLSFVLRSYAENPSFIGEFEKIFLLELKHH